MITPRELNQMVQSDNKLWENAETIDTGNGTLTKTLFLPHGIGQFSLTFEGVHDAAGRRNASGVWGESVRYAVEEAIGDEAVSSRAAQAAALAGTDTSRILSSDGSNTLRSEPVPSQEAIPTLGEAPTSGATPSDRLHELVAYRATLEDLITEAHKRLKGLDREVKALEAYKEIMNDSAKYESSATQEDDEITISEALPDREPEPREGSSGDYEAYVNPDGDQASDSDNDTL